MIATEPAGLMELRLRLENLKGFFLLSKTQAQREQGEQALHKLWKDWSLYDKESGPDSEHDHFACGCQACRDFWVDEMADRSQQDRLDERRAR